jgi:hypothetical protein
MGGVGAVTFNTVSGLGGDLGSYIVGFCSTTSSPGCTPPGNGAGFIATANSGALLVDTVVPAPEPATFTMLGAGFIGLLGIARRRLLKS